ncbi:acyl-CoA synthetase [Mycobacterium intracellulare]|uniref:Acyl-CoA synthetase n=2 Tax=Mycobacterium intracellulare TaxID=1767 RepID=A0A7U5MI74_MYCIT|nr:acyl-CoA synthetase [Mycobacterium intracellulare]ASL14014.1 acyl-CoA synthetase [Mycobacterium intracellulare subsp. chimaera]ASQ85340.1 acyl-CoA synthetase [Mycobacterium intracellulare subsp. chimaera]MCF1815454.1 acyl-CoA synthetase [Mycobacterium intracellulare subsp. intracellulare]MDM3925337.1 acyl-CoA synthetase [Mycobacterium intracellulare subsp. chimaera]MDS0337358.1 acyl-CoA synthetase [Mycobacterium intracellulare]
MLLASLDPSAVTATDIADAVRIDGSVLSRSDLVGAATSVAERVGGAGRVAILAAPTAETVLAVTGCLIAGVPFVPVPADVGAAERRHMLTDSGAQAWLGAAPDETGGLPHIPVRLHARSWHRYPEPSPEATAMIIYTSGTTGLPKGVVLSRRAIAADLDALAEAWQWTADDVLVHGLPLFHVHGLVLGLLGSLRVGNRVIHTGKPTPEGYAAARTDFGGTLFFGVPTVWSRVGADEAAARALGPARLLVSGSAPLPVPVFDRLAALTGHQPVERYGASESLITISTRADGERRPGWVGLPLAGVQTRVLDDDGGAVPHDGETVGKLHVRGPMMFDGYLNRPDATAEAFDTDGWYRTGDVAVIDGGGMHRIVGRESVDLIKSGGYRIGAGEIETVLLGHPGVQEAAVVGVPDADLGQRIVAYIVGSAGGDELIDYVAQQLSVHKRPREVRVVDALPRNAMGKVLKKQLLTDG